MSTAEQLAQALRDLLGVSYNYGVPHNIKERIAACLALAAHEAEKAQAAPKNVCAACNGMGYLDGFGTVCPKCCGEGAAPAAPVAVPLTDDEIRETLKTTNHMVRNCMNGPFWPELEQACRAIARAFAARLGINLEGGYK